MTAHVEASAIFDTAGYLYLPGFLDVGNLGDYVSALRRLVDEGRTVHDDQCPKSQAVHGAPVFDSLLEQLLPHVERASGRKLYPTYAYARLYAPGEVLRPHKDRPACEISVTLCLGFEGAPWPIYMADGDFNTTTHEVGRVSNVARIDMQPGDAVVYKGCEKLHWRDEYREGSWLAQVFLHYVDQAGPYADQKYDGRGGLAHHARQQQIGNGYFAVVEDAVPRDACQKIVDSIEGQAEGEQAAIGGAGVGKIDTRIRDVKRVCLPIHRGIAATMAGVGFHMNHLHWQFDVRYANQCEFLRYDRDGHYHGHLDTFLDPAEPECRKLTVLLFLNDDFEGGRLFLQPEHERIYPPQAPGTALVFPSFLLHGVEPVTSGVRRSLVTWLVGPWFR